MAAPKSGFELDVEIAQAREWARRRVIRGVEVRYAHTARSQTVSLHLCGQELGSKTTVTKRGKVVSTLFYLPDIGSVSSKDFTRRPARGSAP